MWTEQFRVLSRYNTWMNVRLYALAAQLNDTERKRNLGAFFGSIEGTLNHILLADRIWMSRFTGDEGSFVSRDQFGTPIAFEGLSQIVYPVFADLRHNRELLDRQIEFWSRHLTEEQLRSGLTYFNTTGKRLKCTLWQAVTHFFNHQTHHRGQVTTLLFQLGQDPGVTDFSAFIREDGST
ncbi:MAG TPA: DinB family protein [Polyangiaceae bacterium]|nr:DinB family protein [Polyangiaceae bacterium]